MASLFHTLEVEAYRSGIKARTKEARTWWKDKSKELKGYSRNKLLKDDALAGPVSRPRPGDMYMYFYDPKHAKTLPYYDMFPMVIMVDKAPGGFYGLNLHYLSPMVRAKFLDKLMEIANSKRMDDNTRLKISYDLLKGVQKYKEFRPCFKHYLTKHIQGKPVKINAPEWEIAIFLPVEQFAKKNKTHVWGNSKRTIAGG